jgi:hypothetical protein
VREREGAGAVRRHARGSKRKKGEGRKREGKKKGRRKKKRKKRKGKEEKERKEKKKRRKENGNRKGKGLGIREKLLGKLGGKGFAGFSDFSGVGVIFGTAVMARWTGRWDRGVRGIPGTVADCGAGVARVGAGLSAGGVSGIRGTRAVDG